MYIDSLACVRVKWGESERFRINSRVRKGFMSPWLFNSSSDERGKNGIGEKGYQISGGGKSGDCMASCM